MLAACTASKLSYRAIPSPAMAIDSSSITDSVAEATILPYRRQLDAAMNRVIGQSKMVLKKGDMESNLGNFVADLVQSQASRLLGRPVDMGVVTMGGLRIALSPGPIRVADIFELMPFENQLVVITIDGQTCRQLFQYLAQNKNIAIANTKVVLKGNGLDEVWIGGAKLDTLRDYTVATSDYLANGGDKMAFFKNAKQIVRLQPKMRDAIVAHIERLTAQGRMVEAAIEGRVVVK